MNALRFIHLADILNRASLFSTCVLVVVAAAFLYARHAREEHRLNLIRQWSWDPAAWGAPHHIDRTVFKDFKEDSGDYRCHAPHYGIYRFRPMCPVGDFVSSCGEEYWFEDAELHSPFVAIGSLRKPLHDIVFMRVTIGSGYSYLATVYAGFEKEDYRNINLGAEVKWTFGDEPNPHYERMLEK